MGSTPLSRARLAGRLAAAGCVAAEEEAGELLAAAGGDGALLDALARAAARSALAMGAARPRARVVATDLDPAAVACAAANGVEALHGDLLAPLPLALAGRVDVVAGVVPYVPTGALRLLPRDALAHEPLAALDGGPDGAAVLRRAVAGAPGVLRPGGALLLELGGDQADLLAPDLARHGFGDVAVVRDGDGDVRGVEATLLAPVTRT